MECKSCGYALWNLKARQCPECGEAFLPSEFEFVRNSVQFCCPHCDQPYYGTDNQGHLVPDEFNCVRCSQHIHMDECVLRPTSGVRDDQTRPDDMPWLDRKRTGKPIRAFFATVGRSMGSPVRLMAGIRGGPYAGQALWFVALTLLIPTLINMVPIIIIMMIASSSAGGGGAGMSFVVAPWLGMVAAGFVVMLIWMALAHFVVAITGKRKGGMGRTVEAIAYASGPQILTAVPCLGFYLTPVSGIWWMINSIFTLRGRQSISGGRACLAVLPGPILMILLVVGLMVGSIMWTTASLGSMQSWQSRTQMQTLNQELIGYTAAGTGQYPPHGAYLFNSPNTAPYSAFISVNLQSVPVGDLTLQDVIDAPPQNTAIGSALQAAADALSDDVVAHRVGDIVFTYHGIDQIQGDTFELWTMVKKLTPSSPVYGDIKASNAQLPDGVVLAKAGGAVVIVPLDEFDAELQKQNRLRASLGLPPLPDPDDVTYDKPATASNVGQSGVAEPGSADREGG